MLATIFAKNIYINQFNTVLENDTLSRCLEPFKTDIPPVLAVVDEKGKYVGVITRRAILRSRLDPATTKVKSLTQAAPRVNLDYPISQLAKLMIESGIRQLPIVEKEKIIGFVTDENVIHAAVEQEWGSTEISAIMTRAPHAIEANRSVGAVLSLLREYGISHMPVIENGRLVGIVSIQDILENILQPQRRQTLGEIAGEKVHTLTIPAKGIMSSPVITVQPETSLKDAEKKMHEHNISCLAIVLNDKLVGIVTRLDFLELISQIEAVQKKITVQFGLKGLQITPDQQSFMMDEFDSFSRKFQDAFQQGTLFVYMKTHGTTSLRGTPLIHCRLQLRTVKGSFFSTGEGWGMETTFRVALDRLERRLLRSKELLAYNPKYAKDYLRKIGLPQEEL